jgi:hypothetical protein
VIGVLKLKSVIFIEEFQMPFSTLSNGGVIGVKRQLGMKPLADAEDKT